MQISKRCSGFLRRACQALLLAIAALSPLPAFAASQLPVLGAPHPWQIDMQPAYSPVAEDMHWLNDWVLTPLVVFIVVLVGALLAWIMWRYNAKRHPIPSKTTTNTPLEVAWTLLPALALVAIAIPSFKVVYFENKTDDPYMTVKVTGHQWYWEYDYPNQGNLDFNSNMIPASQLKPGDLRLLSVNHPLVVPVGKNIRVLETSGDVIHSFYIPSLGVQRYAIPGETIETWFRADKVGKFYGECNNICGLGHHTMPIEVEAVPLPQFLAWTKLAVKQNASAGTIPPVSAVTAALQPAHSRVNVAELTSARRQAPSERE